MRSLIREMYVARCAYFAIANWRMRNKFVQGNIESESGTTHEKLSDAESVAYIEGVFQDYKYYSGVNKFYGRVAEVGPGDNCGVGLLFLEDGCKSVDLADAFYSLRNASLQATIYKRLADSHPFLKAHTDLLEDGDEIGIPGLNRYYGASATGEKFFLDHSGYDFIVSRAVLEHLRDPLSALRAMFSALNPGGMLLHKVDLRDHNMFSEYYHELKFLETEAKIYELLTSDSGRPNRVLLDRYRECMQNSGLEYRMLVTHLAGVGEITPHLAYEDIPQDLRNRSRDYVRSVRGKFCSQFNDVNDQDLSVAGFFLIAKRH